ncbi:MAG: prepilin-type N-terminal cleavage/methylation domain-containing protein [Desulfuromonadales bacterium]|nr:prepilin-type N-terminal cleavage/methylation domain-containing protein [Desulfuromonadales bacterium]
MKSRGFALTELIVVMTIIGIILAITTLDFGSWMRKYDVDAQIKEMHNDLSDVRLKAVQSKMQHDVVFNSSNYVFIRYSSEGTPGTNVYRKDLKYPIQFVSGGALQNFSGEVMSVNARGYTFNLYTIVIPGQAVASADCLVVSNTRVNMGKYDASTQICSFK